MSPGEGLLVTCLSYLETGGGRGVQVQGRGRLQEDGLARYDVVRFRVLDRREGKKGLGPWHAQPRGKGSRLPVPVAAVPGAKGAEVRLLWLRWEGICRPSAASAWVTDVGAHALEGPRHIAGFGQPCRSSTGLGGRAVQTSSYGQLQSVSSGSGYTYGSPR